jgi:PAS domain S-box-containing protein
LSLFGIVILLGFFLIRERNIRQLNRVIEEGKLAKMVLLNKVIEMKSKSLTTYSSDYTYWDEMVTFVSDKNYEWAERNIVPSLTTFEVDYLWVVQPDLQPIYHTQREDIQPLPDFPVDNKVLSRLLSMKWFHHFFIENNGRVIEVSIAPIHPTTDIKRVTEPSGYYIAGRLWSPTFIEQLGSITESSLKLITQPSNPKPLGKSIHNHFQITNEKPLLDYDNKTIATVESMFRYEKARTISRDDNRIFIFFATIFFLFAIVFVSFFIHKVYRPLRLLSDSLEKEQYISIKELSEKDDEFGKLSKLIDEFGTQKLKLIEEAKERKEIEKQFRILSKAINQSPDSILITDIYGNIEFCNPAVLKISGYSKEEIIGNNPRIFGTGNKTPEEYKVLWDTIASGNIWEGEFLNRKKNGELYWETTTISPVIDSLGNVSHYLAIRKDITEQKKLTQELIIAKEQAEESDRLKSAFLSNMSHEIRTPMNSIMGFASLLPDEESKEIMTQYANIIYKNSEQLVTIIDSIVLYSKLQTHQLSFNPSVFEAGKVLAEIEHNFNMSNSNESLQLICDLSGNETTLLKTDYEKLRQIFYNLVSNATKYTQSGTINIGYKSGDDVGYFYVRDTGIGIPEKDIPHIFERFYRGSNFNESTVRGTGIGLSIAKELVDLLGGKIWVESILTKGSEFKFTIQALYHDKSAFR